MRFGLDLHCRVVDVVAVAEEFARFIEDIVLVGVAGRDQVHRCNVHIRCQRPDVEIVHIDDAVNAQQVASQSREIQVWWSRLYEHSNRP